MPSDERLTIDDLPGMLPSEIVARFDALEAEVARYRERVSFGNHKRAQCEDNLERAEAQLAASEAARAALVEQHETDRERLIGYINEARAELDEARRALISDAPPPAAIVPLVRAALDEMGIAGLHSNPTLIRRHSEQAGRYWTALQDALAAQPAAPAPGEDRS